MKISIIGYSGSGKSTLARIFAEKYNIAILHFDTIQFLPNWVIRDEEGKLKLTKEFLDTHAGWVIDGNYSKLYHDRRMEESDLIILLLFNRFTCLRRCYKRYKRYENLSRPDMAVGCNEKLDFEFIKWILYKGRKKKTRDKFKRVISQYSDKVVVIKNQKQLSRYINSILEN